MVHLPRLTVPHGTYAGIYPDVVGWKEARRELGIEGDAPVILSLGLIRPYKNLDRLLDLARDAGGMTVLIAGPAHDRRYAEGLRARAAGLANVRLSIATVDDARLQYYFRAADLFVLPYRRVTNSGSALLALSFGLPVLGPDLPYFRELEVAFGAGRVHRFRGESLGSADITSATAAGPAEPFVPAGWSWPEIGAAYREFFARFGKPRSR